jgi:hypothetical protein
VVGTSLRLVLGGADDVSGTLFLAFLRQEERQSCKRKVQEQSDDVIRLAINSLLSKDGSIL